MSRLKTLSVLAGIIAALAVSAAPASAWWESNSQANEGKGVVNVSGEFVDVTGGGTAAVKCPANEIEATWSIQTKGEIKVHNKEEKQLKTKAGPHLHFNVLKWGTMCKAKIAETTAQAHVSPCELQLVQPQKGTESQTATAGVVTACRVEAANCTIIVPPGMEKQQGSNEGINVGLKEVTLENVKGTGNQVDKVEVKGIRAEKQANAGCPLTTLGTASLVGMEFTVEGAKLI